MRTNIKNAFNTISRQAVLTAALATASQPGFTSSALHGAYGHLAAYYGAGRSHDLWYTAPDGTVSRISSLEGVQQGDPLAMLLFCIALHPVLEAVGARHPDAELTFLADDGALTGGLHKVLPMVADLVASLATLGAVCQPLKCTLYAPAAADDVLHRAAWRHDTLLSAPGAAVRVDAPAPLLALDSAGYTFGGVAHGTDAYIRAHLDAVVGRAVTQLGDIKDMPHGLVHLSMVNSCINSRLMYFLRTHAPHHTAGPAAAFDGHILAAFQARAEWIPAAQTAAANAAAVRQLRAPRAAGGLGLTAMAPLALSAYLRAIYCVLL